MVVSKLELKLRKLLLESFLIILIKIVGSEMELVDWSTEEFLQYFTSSRFVLSLYYELLFSFS